MTEATLLRLWAKADDTPPARHHPLLFHMLDSAHIARLLWSEVFGAYSRQQLAQALGLREGEAGSLVPLIAGLHDLGKASPGFQSLSPSLADRLREAGLFITEYAQRNRRPHGHITTRELRRILRAAGWDSRPAAIVAGVAGAHHGTFFSGTDLGGWGEDTLGDASWAGVREDLVRSLCTYLTAVGHPEPMLAPEDSRGAGIIPFLAGLVSVADWIASSEEHFPYEPEATVADYAAISRERARAALVSLGWLPPLRPADRAEFARVFPSPEGPNALQQQVARAMDRFSQPYVLLVEAPMGEGKTEAALYAADAGICAGAARGLYVALPTQATGNAMHRRVRDDYLARRGHSGALNLQLVHGNALLSREYDQWRLRSVHEEEAADPDRGRVSAESWFAARKRPLLAPFGVGTIDQGLLSVLQARHWFVRLFGLANKVVIFDEVHAYDTYMTAILERLLQWLAAVNSSVVLLSATLPASRRQRLLRAHAGERAEAAEERPYPRLTWAGPAGSGTLTVPASEYSRRAIALEFAPTEVEGLAADLQEALSEGGCAAVVCNTVARAQQVYQALQEALRDSACLLFHARTPFAWRRGREEEVLACFGKGGARPPRAVLVATQVVEQSLDLDFDWMASEMAPADLLLQRAGRMHRHRRERPPKLRSPRLVVVCDGDPTGGPPDFGGSARVYERYVLLRSWLALRARRALRLPDDIEALVEQVYGEADVPAPDPAWADALAEAKAEMEKKQRRAEREAEAVLVPAPGDPQELLAELLGDRDLKEDEDPTIHATLRAATRLGPPSVQVVCLEDGGGGDLRPVTGGGPIRFDEEPSADQTMELLEASLPLSDRGLFRVLRDQEVPPGWRRSPHLRFHRHLVFRDGRAELAGRALTIHPDLGLVIEKKEEGR